MDPITFCAHRNLIISVAIGSDLRFAGSTLNFHIFCLRFGPPIIPRIPHYGVCRTTHKLMSRDTRPSRTILTENRRVYTHTLIIQVFFNIPRANFLQNSSLGSGIAFLPQALEYTVLALVTEKIKVNCRLGQKIVCQTCSRPIVSCLLLFIPSTQCLLERHPLPIFFPVGGMIGHFVE